VRVVLLSGGGGGARWRAASRRSGPGELTVIGNVGDDLEILGLHVSPDLDSLLYTLAGSSTRARLGARRGELERPRVGAAWGGPTVPARRP
jgi:LPPG:FO 2-phospho-L-lactate transferase